METEAYPEHSENDEGRKSPPTFLADLGRRVGVVIDNLGEDISVSAARKSWKQLGRYRAGAEPPLGVIKGLAEAARVSLAWFVEGRLQTPEDDTMEIALTEQRLEELEAAAAKPDDYEHRRDTLLKVLAALHQHREASIAWESRGREPLPFGVPEAPAPVPVMPGQMLLPRYDVRASAGAGALVISEDVSEYFGAPRDFIRKNLPSWAPANAEVGIIENGGDSMWPTIHDGDLLVVVQGPGWRVVERGGIFVFTLDDRLLLKRLQVLDNGDLLIISDNKQYQPMTVARRELTERLHLHAQVFLTVGKPRNATVSGASTI